MLFPSSGTTGGDAKEHAAAIKKNADQPSPDPDAAEEEEAEEDEDVKESVVTLVAAQIDKGKAPLHAASAPVAAAPLLRVSKGSKLKHAKQSGGLLSRDLRSYQGNIKLLCSHFLSSCLYSAMGHGAG